MKLATEYNMLSFVGSDIDDFKMDEYSYLKLVRQIQNGTDDSKPINLMVELDTHQSCLLQIFDKESFIGLQPPFSNLN